MKNLIFLILILFTACTENEMDNKLGTEVLSELNYESTYQFSPDKKYSRGIPIIAHNGVAYLFEEKKEGVFNNALIMLPQVREDISKLPDICARRINPAIKARPPPPVTSKACKADFLDDSL